MAKPTEADPMAAPVVKYNPTEAEIAKAGEEYAALVADPDSYKKFPLEVKGALKRLGEMRREIDGVRLEAGREHREYIKRVNAEGFRLVGLVMAIEKPLLEQKGKAEEEEKAAAEAIVKAKEAKEAAEKKAKEEAEEAERKAK